MDDDDRRVHQRWMAGIIGAVLVLLVLILTIAWSASGAMQRDHQARMTCLQHNGVWINSMCLGAHS